MSRLELTVDETTRHIDHTLVLLTNISPYLQQNSNRRRSQRWWQTISEYIVSTDNGIFMAILVHIHRIFGRAIAP